MIRRYRNTYEGCDLVPLVTSSTGDSELIIQFQEAYAMLFPNCYNKQGFQSNLICTKVYPEGIQQIKGNKCGLIPETPLFFTALKFPIILKTFCWYTGGVSTRTYDMINSLTTKKQTTNFRLQI